MAHRSNQAVASQEQTPEGPADQPPARRLLVGWLTAFAALGVSTAIVALGVWLVRLPLAEFVLESALSERGAHTDLQVVNLDFGGATLANVIVGAEEAPDAAIAAVEARWAWSGLSPRLASLRLVEPKLRLRLDGGGHVSAGSLDQLERGPPSRVRPSIARIALEVVDGRLLIEAPFGLIEAHVESQGVIGDDFRAVARIEETTRQADAFSVDAGAGELLVTSQDGALNARLIARTQALTWADARLQNVVIEGNASAPLDLASADLDFTWRVGALETPGAQVSQLSGGVRGNATLRDDALEIASWRGEGRITAALLGAADATLRNARGQLQAEGAANEGRGRWTIGGDRFDGFAFVSEQPAAAGRIFMDAGGALRGDALITLAQSALNEAARQSLDGTFPNLPDAPIGPTFSAAERALGAAARRFTLTVPLSLERSAARTRVTLLNGATAVAASGAQMRLTPLREDSPGVVLQWTPAAPTMTLFGAVSLDLSGGGTPSAALLLDTLNWQPGAPFEADGTLTLSDWRSEGASIAAEELGVSIALAEGVGRVDLRGGIQITGPLGDGRIERLAPALDLAAAWSEQGWRVTSNAGCFPTRVGSIQAAGLAFTNGAFELCPLDNALIAANASRSLSGGFSVRSLALNGRMAGPEAQPARLSASNIVGRFRGQPSDFTLALEAGAPSLEIEMGAERTLAITMRRIMADAHITDGWRIEGAFEQGTLTDPTLPGTLSTIAGGWSAEPEDGAPVIRVTAGEALLAANRPATDAERPLFNPLRLTNVSAVLKGGNVDANGAIVLADRARQLAHFTATHDVEMGLGSAHVLAENLVFDESLQPYDITERTRGMVDNVRGPAVIDAAITWTRNDIVGVGTAHLNGISLATATIPVVSDVRGAVYFNDLFALTTPPGQSVTVGVLDPGIAVRNGRVRFQLLSEQRVSIEAAAFDFASGVLEMAPTTITLGADETHFELRLRDVDAAALLATLNIPDLAATGRVEGEFPLLLTRRTAFIENGVLRAQPGGGIISYTGNAGQSATGPARIAFDALRSFNYDDLTLTLNGDLNGEVISSIVFSGENSGRPVDLGPIAPIPGIGRVTVRGVPFDFNVRVTAPFRRLAQTAASITDPGSLLNQARDQATDDNSPESVDQSPSPPR